MLQTSSARLALIRLPFSNLLRPAAPLLAAPATSSRRFGATADLCVRRFRCTEEEAKRVEGKLQERKRHGGDYRVYNGRCDELQKRLSLSEAELKKVVVSTPPVLGYNFKDNVEPSLAKLQNRLDLSEAELKKVVVKLPPVLGYSFEENVEPSLTKLQKRLGLSEAELKKVVLSLPSVIGCSFEKNLEPKLDFLQAELGLSLEEIRGRVVACPTLLGYSLTKRYKPRLIACDRINADSMLVLKSVTLTDVNFCERLGFPLEELHALAEKEEKDAEDAAR